MISLASAPTTSGISDNYEEIANSNYTILAEVVRLAAQDLATGADNTLSDRADAAIYFVTGGYQWLRDVVGMEGRGYPYIVEQGTKRNIDVGQCLEMLEMAANGVLGVDEGSAEATIKSVISSGMIEHKPLWARYDQISKYPGRHGFDVSSRGMHLNSYHGRPCNKCGETVRYKSNGNCVNCRIKGVTKNEIRG